MRLDAPFPDRCVRCNAPAHGFRLKRVFFFVVGARKTAVLHLGLCEKHRSRYRFGVTIGWSSVALGLTLLFGGAASGSGGIIFSGIAVLLVGGVLAAVLAMTITSTRISHDNVWITGVHRDFLDQLPEWHDRS